jgi:NCS2 family nucleobase:cation symporter-2
MPDWVATIFGTSAITPCAIMAIILNSILPPEDNTPENKNLKPLEYEEKKA